MDDQPVKPTVIYLSGPMTGQPNWNFPAFNAAAADLRAKGYTVLNPAETDNGDTSKPWQYYIRKDLRMLTDADAIVVLPGWRQSRGAQLEVMVAQAMGMPVLDTGLQPVVESVCQEADRIVSHDRQGDYGAPIHDFTRTGRMMGAVLSEWARTTKGESPIPPELIPLCMVCVKLSREVNKPKRDNRVDCAGYMKCADMVHEYRAEHAQKEAA